MHPTSIQVQSREIPIHRILLSYPLSVRGFLTVFNTRKYRNTLSALLREATTKTMVIYGTSDQFTSASSYRSWIQELVNLYGTGSDPRAKSLTTHEVEGADHFWGNHETQLCDLVETWLRDIPS
jgi:alpha/beta superfamily hydrolase